MEQHTGEPIGILLDNIADKDTILSRERMYYRSGNCYAFLISPADWRLRKALQMVGYEVMAKCTVRGIERFMYC
jgi:hypothetical protein